MIETLAEETLVANIWTQLGIVKLRCDTICLQCNGPYHSAPKIQKK
jgi:hypothetical protein